MKNVNKRKYSPVHLVWPMGSTTQLHRVSIIESFFRRNCFGLRNLSKSRNSNAKTFLDDNHLNKLAEQLYGSENRPLNQNNAGRNIQLR